jgi:ribonuclease E
MNDPSANDDDWNDLARELGLEKSPDRAPPPLDPIEGSDDPEAEPVGEERPAQRHEHAEPELETAYEGGEEFEDAAGEEAVEGEVEGGEEGPPGEGQPGTGRKRRRRRRRRKKGGGPAQPAEAGSEAAAGESDDEEVVGYGRPTGADEEVLQEAAAGEEADEVGASDGPVADEDTTSDVLRELIATWNVPSWDEIVGGLNRPGG